VIQIPQGVQATETSTGNMLMTEGVGHDVMLQCKQTMQLVKSILEMKNI